MGKWKQTNDLEKELVESGNWTRISEIVEEIKQLYKSERNARAHRTNLLLGQKFLELRRLVTGKDEEFNPKSAEGRRWGRFAKTYLKGCGVSRATTYRCAAAWRAASAMLPEPVLSQLAKKEEMIGVAVSGEKPLGKFTLAMEAATENEPNFEDQDDVEAFIENVLATPEQPKKADPMHSLYVRVIRGLVAIAKGRQTKTTMDGEKRGLTAEMLREPLYMLVSTVQRGIEMYGTHDYETASDLPEGYGDWTEVITPKATGNANSKAKPKIQESKIPAAKKTKAAKPVDEKKEYMKRWRAVKKAAKHYLNMFDELKALDEINHRDGFFNLKEMYPEVTEKTRKEFEANWETALDEMNKVLDEGVAKGWMTTEPSKPTSPVAASEETLKEADAESIAVPDEEQECDYTEDEVAAMFAGGKSKWQRRSRNQ